MKKLVFSKRKCMKDLRKCNLSINKLTIGWCNILDGLTEEEINAKGYATNKDWMVYRR